MLKDGYNIFIYGNTHLAGIEFCNHRPSESEILGMVKKHEGTRAIINTGTFFEIDKEYEGSNKTIELRAGLFTEKE